MEVDTTEPSFSAWLAARGATVSSKVGLAQFGAMGRGAVALEDIEPDTVLFSLPRTLLLTTSTSLLPSLLPAEAWSTLEGWAPLIVILMYERLRSATVDVAGGWTSYFNIMPPAHSFDSLMFWSASELAELEGSMVLGKIGREEAEESFVESVLPFIRAHTDVFGEAESYTLELFHHMGSLVLSRSFHVESGEEEDKSDDEDEEEEESVADVAMVPMADLLNARSGSDNARLFYEPSALNMLSTSFIPAGSQIFNTYADPPNSDLLRRYGHVDDENSADLVEIGLESVVDLIGEATGLDEQEREVRAEWLLEVGIEDTFSLDTSHVLPEEFISAIRTFVATPAEFAKAQAKESAPRGKLDSQVAEWARKLIAGREAQYPTTIAADELLLLSTQSPALTTRHRMALIVRLREKRILAATREKLEQDWPAGQVHLVTIDKKKRKGDDSSSSKKRSKIAL